MGRGSREAAAPRIDCRCRITTEKALVVATFQCLSCEGPGTLESPVCMTRVVENLSREITVDTIVLADALHRSYDAEAKDLVIENARLLQHLALASERPPAGVGEKRSPCGGCEWRPEALFGALGKAATEGLSMFHTSASERAARAARGEAPTTLQACDGCVAKSLDDLRLAVERTRELKSVATRRVVVHGPQTEARP